MSIVSAQDLPKALTTSEVTEGLGLASLSQRKWLIKGACAPTGEGLYEGLDWLAKEVAKLPA
jgi:ADP-ribosylation factor 1/2